MVRRSVKKDWQAAWYLRAITCIDLTTLGGDDTESNVKRLCFKAKNPVHRDLIAALGVGPITCGAVCVYPNRVAEAAKYLKGTGIPIASVAAGFPAGQTPLDQRLQEIECAVSYGATGMLGIWHSDRKPNTPTPCIVSPSHLYSPPINSATLHSLPCPLLLIP